MYRAPELVRHVFMPEFGILSKDDFTVGFGNHLLLKVVVVVVVVVVVAAAAVAAGVVVVTVVVARVS